MIIGQSIWPLVDFCKRFEGLAKKVGNLIYPYKCPAGYWTQGYGLLVSGPDAKPITPEMAEARLYSKLPYYINETIRLCPGIVAYGPDVIAAIADFTFNLGAARLKSSTLRRKINDGDMEGACKELARWTRGGGRVLPGLVLRRAAEIALIRNALNQ